MRVKLVLAIISRRRKIALACAAILAMLTLGGATAQAQTVLINNLQPTFGVPGDGGGGVYSAYYGPGNGYVAVAPGTTAVFDGRAAGIIKAGLAIDPVDLVYEDEGLFAFKPTVTINVFAAGPLTYDVENQAGVNPVWMTIEIDTGVVGDRSDNTVYQFVPTTNPAGWHTFDAAAGLWQKWNDNNGDTTGNPLISLGQVALDNTGLNVVRTYLRLGMGNSYNNGGTGTIAWVDKATIGDVTYDFVVGPIVISVNSAPSVGMIGTNVNLSSEAIDPAGLTDIFYNLFTPGGTFVCNLAHVTVSGSPTSYADGPTLVAAPMPFAGLDTGVGGPCPIGGIPEGSYVLAANWIDSLGNQVGAPNNQVLSNYQPNALFSPFIFDMTPPTVTAPGTVTLYTGPTATTCDVTVANLNATLGTATASDSLTGVASIVRTGVPAGNVFPVGTTIVTYTATDGAGNMASANQTVIVKDNTAPTLTLLGANSMTILYGQTFIDPGATALDNCDGDLTGAIVRTGSVNSFAVGTYTLTYKVTDASSNSTTKTRTVKVLPNPPASKDQCKNDGWRSRTNRAGQPFKNQGQCIDYVNDKKDKDKDKDKDDRDDKGDKDDKHDH